MTKPEIVTMRQEAEQYTNDVLSVIGDKKMYIPEKRMYLQAMHDLFESTNFYADRDKSLYLMFR